MRKYLQKFEYSCLCHLYNRSGSGKNIFRDHDDNLQFLKGLEKYLCDYTSIYAYCLMPNHLHILVHVRSKEEIDSNFGIADSKAKRNYLKNEADINQLLEDQFRRWFSSYVLKYNKKYEDRGQLFLKRYKRICIREEFKIDNAICYIHHNPIHHKFRSNYQSWKYSSYNYYVNKLDSFLDKDYVLERVGGIKAFIKIHEAYKNEMANETRFPSLQRLEIKIWPRTSETLKSEFSQQ